MIPNEDRTITLGDFAAITLDGKEYAVNHVQNVLGEYVAVPLYAADTHEYIADEFLDEQTTDELAESIALLFLDLADTIAIAQMCVKFEA